MSIGKKIRVRRITGNPTIYNIGGYWLEVKYNINDESL